MAEQRMINNTFCIFLASGNKMTREVSLHILRMSFELTLIVDQVVSLKVWMSCLASILLVRSQLFCS